MAKVRAHFAGFSNHNPSEAMYEAMAAIPETIHEIVRGHQKPTLAPPAAYYVSPLDTGIGKTTTLKFALETMLLDGYTDYSDVGTIIAVARLENMRQIIEDMALPRSMYACFVADSAENADLTTAGRGMHDKANATVLFTTHEMMARRIVAKKLTTWAEASDFWYRGRPRPLRVYDEQMVPGIPVRLRQIDFAKAGTAVLEQFSEIGFSLLDYRINDLPIDEPVQLPHFLGDKHFEAIIAELSQTNREIAYTHLGRIHHLAGHRAMVRADTNRAQRVILDFYGGWPEDAKPMLVLDASARVRDTYKQHNMSRPGTVVMLKDAEKRHDNVTVHIRTGGTGKGALSNDGRGHKRMQDVADIIRQHPKGSCLVIHHKAGRKMLNVEVELQRLLKDTDHDTAFLTWGRHDAVNDYRDRTVVIMPTVLFKPDTQYEVDGRVASQTPGDEEYGGVALDNLTRGEVMADVQQALGRSAIRNSVGDQAQATTVYVWRHPQSRVKPDYETILPGCKIVNGKGGLYTERKPNADDRILATVRGATLGVDRVEVREIIKKNGMVRPNVIRALKRNTGRLQKMGLRYVPGTGPSRPARVERLKAVD
jgi:hypothetical protein